MRRLTKDGGIDMRFEPKFGKTWSPRKKTRIAAAHPLTRELFEIMQARKVTTRSLSETTGYSEKTMSAWRYGRNTPTVHSLADMAQALGYELVLRPLSKVADDTLDKI